jgi:hypothetical protein
MKPFLLIAGSTYYPSQDTGDWIGCFSTREEAEAQIRTPGRFRELQVQHPRFGETDVDWYEIVDLRDWGAYGETDCDRY